MDRYSYDARQLALRGLLTEESDVPYEDVPQIDPPQFAGTLASLVTPTPSPQRLITNIPQEPPRPQSLLSSLIVEPSAPQSQRFITNVLPSQSEQLPSQEGRSPAERKALLMNSLRNETTGKQYALPTQPRSHDVFRDGPLELGRQRTPDGGEMIIKRVAGLDGFGRQTARVVQEFVPPPDLARMKQSLEIQLKQKELNQGPKAPEGYRLNPDGSMSFIKGGPADPSMRSVNKPMSSTAQKELIESDESIQGGNAAIDLLSQAQKMNDSAMGFSGAGMLAKAGTILPDAIRPDSVDATLNLDNILQSQALPQLKSIFGGMPTEGERKILLDIQGSSSQPAKVRAEIFKRAENAIQNRLAFSKDKAQRLRAGTYFSGDGAVGQQAASPNVSANTVTLPDGRVKTFPSAAAAQAYKQAAGL